MGLWVFDKMGLDQMAIYRLFQLLIAKLISLTQSSHFMPTLKDEM